MNDMISLDILLVTYNQEQYIQQALDGVLMQRVSPDVQVRIIVADDCSKDNTLAYIRETLGTKAKLASGNEAEVVYLSTEHNLGIAGNYKRAIAATTGDCVAILEGDDYWTDAYRLQKHIDYLSTHTDCVMTANDYMEYSQEQEEWMWKPVNRKYLLLCEMIANYCLANLSARVYRGNVLRGVGEKVFEYGERQFHEATDVYITFEVLRHGYGAVLDEVMSVYRVATGTNMSIRGLSDAEELERGRIRYEQIEEMFNGMYREEARVAYNETMSIVKKDKQKRRVEAWSEYIPPFMARIVWCGFPAFWHWIKSVVRACIPNAMHRKVKGKK